MPCRFIGVTVAGALAGAAQAGTVLHVDDDAPLGGDGLSWDTAYRYLQDALANAAAGTEIRVGQGTYTPDQDEAGNVIPGDLLATFQLLSGVSIRGGFAGIGAPDADRRDVELFETILSGDLLGNDDRDDFPFGPSSADNSRHVTTASGTDETAVLDGFTVTAGVAVDIWDTFVHDNGAGMYNESGSPTVAHCHFRHNAAFTLGGAMYCPDGCAPTMAHCAFTANTAMVGAGINCHHSTLTMTDCSFTANFASVGVGGVFAANSTLFAADCVFNSNVGAFVIGGLDLAFGSGTIRDCVFAFNDGGFTAGGVDTVGEATLTNCLFVSNRAGIGAGLAGANNPLLVNCTFFGNLGTAIDSDDDVTVTNCIIWENTAAVDAPAPVVTFSDIEGGLPGPGNIDADPLFVEGPTGTWSDQATYDPDTGLTTFVDASASFVPEELSGKFLRFDTDFPIGFQLLIIANTDQAVSIWGDWASFGNPGVEYEIRDFRLLPDSPCIDAGDNSAVPQDIEADLGGNPRFLDVPETPDTGNGDPPIVDMGAYESLGGGCLAISSQDVVCHPDGSTFTLNVDGVSACTGDTVMAAFTGSGGAVGEDLCFTVMVDNEQGFCCSSQVCVVVPDCSEALADLDGDGMVGAADLMILLAQLGPCTGDCWADMDHDGMVGVTDLLILLANWDS